MVSALSVMSSLTWLSWRLMGVNSSASFCLVLRRVMNPLVTVCEIITSAAPRSAVLPRSWSWAGSTRVMHDENRRAGDLLQNPGVMHHDAHILCGVLFTINKNTEPACRTR